MSACTNKKDRRTKKPVKISTPSKAIITKVTKRETKKKQKKVKKKARERLTVAQEQVILTRFSRGETLESVQRRYIKGLGDEIRNLKNAFDAGEFLLKDGVWQLVS